MLQALATLGVLMLFACAVAPGIAVNAKESAFARTRRTRRARQRGHARTRTLQTRHLHATLDDATGTLRATVRTGAWRGRRLDHLTRETVMELHHAWAGDEPSRRLLDAWLDQTHEGWRTCAATHEKMTEEEAHAILGTRSDDDETTVVHAHRRAMMDAHPDRGGSDARAARVNEARDRLLRPRKGRATPTQAPGTAHTR